MDSRDQKAYLLLKEIQPKVEQKLKEYFEKQINDVARDYTPYSKVAIDALYDVCTRGGKRLRAGFVYYAYLMLGGKDQKSAMQLAAIIEIIHAYLLVIDDFMDLSATRRGGLTAHEIIKKYHVDARLKHDSTHFGNAIAVTAGIMGSHMAMQWLSELNVAPETRVALAQNLNRMLVVTSQGQINDVFNESLHQVTEKDVINVLLWKTSAYTYENPLHSGAILAGASLKELDTLSEYSYWGGIAFQIKDDILGTFGEVDETGKSNMDDIREGKMTLLSVKALEMANSADRRVLQEAIGNRILTEDMHKEVKEIMLRTGAKEYTEQVARDYTEKAKMALEKGKGGHWDEKYFNFLLGICEFVINRNK